MLDSLWFAIYHCHIRVCLWCFSFQTKEITCWKLYRNNTIPTAKSNAGKELSTWFEPELLPPLLLSPCPWAVRLLSHKSGPQSCKDFWSRRMLIPHVARAKRQAGRRKAGCKNKSSIKLHGQLHPKPPSVTYSKQGFHGQLLPSHTAPVAYLGTYRCGGPHQHYLEPTFPSTYPVPASGTCWDKPDTQNHPQKDDFWDLNYSLFKCCSMSFNLSTEGKKEVE